MQIQTGTVAVTNNSNTVVGTGVNWAQVAPNRSLFFINPSVSGNIYVIVTVNASTSTITLDRPYAEATQASTGYAIEQDFTVNYNLPLLAKGDVNTAELVTRGFTLIDAALSNVIGGGSNTLPITQIAHGFVAGSVLTYSGSMYALAQADTAAQSNVVGVVLSVTNANAFILQFVGTIPGLTGLTANTVYYLANAAHTSAGINFTSNTAYASILTPVMIGQSTTSAMLLVAYSASLQAMTAASSGSGGSAGAVPAPSAGQQGYCLHGDATWERNLPELGATIPGNTGVNWSHLMTGTFTGSNWTNPDAGTGSVSGALKDLNSRINNSGFALPRKVSYLYPGIFYWYCPIGVTSVLISCIGAGGNYNEFDSIGGGGGEYAQILAGVTAGLIYVLTVGAPGSTSTANIQSGNTQFQTPALVPVCVAHGGWSSPGSGLGGQGGTGGTGSLVVSGQNGWNNAVTGRATGGDCYYGGGGGTGLTGAGAPISFDNISDHIYWPPGPSFSLVGPNYAGGCGAIILQF